MQVVSLPSESWTCAYCVIASIRSPSSTIGPYLQHIFLFINTRPRVLHQNSIGCTGIDFSWELKSHLCWVQLAEVDSRDQFEYSTCGRAFSYDAFGKCQHFKANNTDLEKIPLYLSSCGIVRYGFTMILYENAVIPNNTVCILWAAH